VTPTFPALAFYRDVGRYAEAGREKVDYFLSAEDFPSARHGI